MESNPNPNPNPPQPESHSHTHTYNGTHTHKHTHTHTHIYNNMEHAAPPPANVEAAPEEPEETVNQAAIDENERRVRLHRPLYDAASSGNWENAERFLIENPTADITQAKQNGMTILHVAATMGHAGFISRLFLSGRFPRDAMRLLDKLKWSALHYAASYGHLDVVRVLVGQDNTLTQVLDGVDYKKPLRQAASNGANERVLWYLVNETPNDPSLSGVEGAQLINAMAVAGYYDICLCLLYRDPQLANHLLTPELDLITSLIRWPDLFRSGSRLNILERCIYDRIPIVTYLADTQQRADTQQQQFFKRTIRWISGAASKAIAYVPIFKRIRDVKYKHKRILELLEVTCDIMSTWRTKDFKKYFETFTDSRGSVLYYSAKNGVTETISAIIKHAPDYMDEHAPNVDIILWSIEHRQEHVFNFMMERDVFVKLLPEYANDEEGETYLHAAAKLAPYARLTSVSSPALQMQRELQWFRGVEKFVRPIMMTYVNKNGQTPRELFTTEHEDLAEKAEKWMKDTANSCLVVAALIITVVFAAAFTIPGGLDDKGIASFLNRWDFRVFVISDAVGMFSAATSIFMFLSILTARYAVDDFLSALPKRLILGLVFLLFAIVSMMVAFGAALYIILYPRYKWIVIFLIIGITSIPVVSFFILQLPLIWAMVISTCGPSILKPMKTPW